MNIPTPTLIEMYVLKSICTVRVRVWVWVIVWVRDRVRVRIV